MIKLKDLLNEARLTPYQIFVTGTGGDKNFKFNPKKVPTGRLKVGSQMACQNKPVVGFWTSSYREKTKDTEWSEFTRTKIPHWHSGMGAVFKVVGSPKIAVVRNQKDYDKLVKKYQHDTSDMGCPAGDQYLNWHELAKYYDGYHFAMSGKGPIGHLDWDVESVAWFNMSQLNFVGTIKT